MCIEIVICAEYRFVNIDFMTEMRFVARFDAYLSSKVQAFLLDHLLLERILAKVDHQALTELCPPFFFTSAFIFDSQDSTSSHLILNQGIL